MPVYTMPDGSEHEFESDEIATQAYEAWDKQYGSPTRPSLTPQQIEQQKRVAAESMTRAQVPEWIRQFFPGVVADIPRARDFLTGATGVTRGTLNLMGADLQAPEGVDRNSGMFIAGTLADPTAMMVGGGAGKIVQGAKVLQPIRSIPRGAVAGAAGGGAVGALSEDSNALTGATFGGVMGAALPVAGRIASGIRNNFGASGADIRAGRTLRELAGENLPQIEQQLAATAGQDLRTVQALRGKGGAELAALDEALQNRMGGRLVDQQARQEAARLQRMIPFSGGSSAEMAANARQVFKDTLNKSLDPMRVKGAENANAMTRYAVELADDVARYRDEAQQAVQKVRDMTAARERAAEMSSDPRFLTNLPEGQPRISGRYTYISELEQKAEQAALDAAEKSLDAGTLARLRESQLESVAEKFAPLRLTPVLRKIEETINSTDYRTNPVVVDSLTKLKGYIKQFVDPKTGTIDAYDLHGIRKNVNQIVDMLYPNADNSIKTAAAGAIGKLKPTIDDTLMKAGGRPLVQYFEKYAEGMNKLKQMEFAATAQKLTPNQLIRLATGQSPERVERMFGPGRTSLKEEMGAQATGAIRLNAAEVARDRQLKELAKAGSGTAAEVLQRNMFNMGVPNMLNRAAVTFNTALSQANSFMNREMVKRLTDAMYNPTEFTRLVNTLPAEQRSKLVKALLDARTAGVAGGITGQTAGVAMGGGQ